MPTTYNISEAKLLAVVLQGEDNYWFAEPRTSKPLEENWTHVGCFWLYPVESGIAQFADLKEFDPTDSVFEIDTQGVSKVLRAATLSSDVAAKKYHQGKRTFYFITQKEISRMDIRYSALLKREAEVLPLLHQQDEVGRNGGHKTQVGDIPSDTHEEPKNNAPKVSHIKEEDDEATKTFKSEQMSLIDRRSHQRKTPYQGTTTYIAPDFNKPTGDHCSSEAFEWDRYYIIHRGSVDYLVPEPIGNTYGFRLDKVSHDGFPVFLLFGSSVKNSYEVEPSANAVPAMDSAVLKGGGGETERVGSHVLVLTRPRGKRSRANNFHARADSVSFSPGKASRSSSRSISASDNGSEGAKAALSLVVPSRKRGRPRKVPFSTPSAESEATASAKVPALPPREHHKSHESSRKTDDKPREPLQACSVNVWTDLTSEISSFTQLATQFPFSHNPSKSLRTVVFPDGTCATYSSTTAEDFLKSTDTRRHSNGANQSASSSGGGAPVDDDMRSLLEHIQLAKQQVNA
ncbi:unnamed protein product [Phytomonas sp. EM1]|nr:unnamed protein product [Phytomonas sp. EM1]|eukprot:CCW62726.1 unnamed protein product [Phytomonas sp. isolate EM1]